MCPSYRQPEILYIMITWIDLSHIVALLWRTIAIVKTLPYLKKDEATHLNMENGARIETCAMTYL